MGGGNIKDVEFNLDREESESLSGAGFTIHSGTGLTQSVVTTDANGVASTIFNVSTAQASGSLALVIDAVQQTELVVVEVPA